MSAEPLAYRAKPEIALAELDWLREAEVTFGCVLADDGTPKAGGQHLPGEPAWLVGEWRDTGERKYYLANHPLQTTLRAMAAAIEARWSCEQAHQHLKEELALDNFEGRTWLGLNHHALMTLISFAFLQHLRLREIRARGEMEPTCRGGPPQPSLPTIRHALLARECIVRLHCPKCDGRLCTSRPRRCGEVVVGIEDTRRFPEQG